MRRAKAAGLIVRFNHGGIAVLECPPEKAPPAVPSVPPAELPLAAAAGPASPPAA